MRNKGTWVGVFFLAVSGLVAMVLDLALSDLFAFLRIQDTSLLGERFTLTTFLAVIIAGLIAAYTGLMNKKSKSFVTQCLEELNKSHWPTWPETKINTFTVIVTSIIAAIILGVFDSVFSWLTKNNLFLG